MFDWYQEHELPLWLVKQYGEQLRRNEAQQTALRAAAAANAAREAALNAAKEAKANSAVASRARHMQVCHVGSPWLMCMANANRKGNV